jgi:Flp pilus assembly protein TadG
MPRLTSLMSLLRRLRDRREGTIAMIFGLCFIPVLIASVGLAVDMANIYDARVRLGAALDDAALAVAGTVTTNTPPAQITAQLTNQLNKYMAANFPNTAIGRNVTASMSDPTQPTINLTATATVDMTIMQILNFPPVTITVAAQVTKGFQNLEMALVLDNTGSMMCGDADISVNILNCPIGTPPSHMTTLRTDAQDIVDTMFKQQPPGTTTRIALVPYVTSVNIGTAMGANLSSVVTTKAGAGFTDALGHPAYLDYKGAKILDSGGLNITYDATQSETSTEWLGCVIEPTVAGEDAAAAGPDMSDPAGYNLTWTPYWWATGSGTGFLGDTNTWVVATKVPKAQAKFTESLSGDYVTTANGAYHQSYGPNLGCPKPIVRLTSDQAALDLAVQNLASRANSGTIMHVGMIWGWRVLSPDGGPFKDGAPYSDKTTLKAVVLETDGQNDIGATALTGLGYLADGKMGSTTVAGASTNLTNRLSVLCTNMKNAGIIIYTIGLGLGANGTATTALKNCAGPAGKGAFYAAPTAADLQAAFQGIAASLNNIRLSK